MSQIFVELSDKVQQDGNKAEPKSRRTGRTHDAHMYAVFSVIVLLLLVSAFFV